jgi:hypothetical protein
VGPTANCIGIQACVKLKILSIEYEFKAKMELIPKEYKLEIFIEKWKMTIYIFQGFGEFKLN